MVHSKKLTNQIVERNKIQSFQEIFRDLDSDGDGMISAYRINIANLDPALLQVLSPLFVEMEEIGISLSQDDFIDAVNRLYKTVSLPEKILLNRKHKQS